MTWILGYTAHHNMNTLWLIGSQCGLVLDDGLLQLQVFTCWFSGVMPGLFTLQFNHNSKILGERKNVGYICIYINSYCCKILPIQCVCSEDKLNGISMLSCFVFPHDTSKNNFISIRKKILLLHWPLRVGSFESATPLPYHWWVWATVCLLHCWQHPTVM